MSLIKKLEMVGRKFLLWLCAKLLSLTSNEPITRLDRIAVIRLDPRVGNLILLTPLLSSLKLRFPQAALDVLVNQRSAVLLEEHPAIDNVLHFDKKTFLGQGGVFSVWGRIRANRYDLVIDASNPTFPSTTQALIVRFSKARFTTGVGLPGMDKIFTHPVCIEETETSHEIDLRLQLLSALPGQATTRSISLGQKILRAGALEQTNPLEPQALLNVGARLKDKQLNAQTYALIAQTIIDRGHKVTLTYGPAEMELAAQTQALCEQACLAPPTSLSALAYLMSQATLVVSCDTGPMHIAAATGSPTLGIFVSTPPARYGYTDGLNAVIDARNGFEKKEFQELTTFIAGLDSPPST